MALLNNFLDYPAINQKDFIYKYFDTNTLNPIIESNNINPYDSKSLNEDSNKTKQTILINETDRLQTEEQNNLESIKIKDRELQLGEEREIFQEKTFTPADLFVDPRFNHYIDIYMKTIKDILTTVASYNSIQRAYLKDLSKPFGYEDPIPNIQDISNIIEFVQQAEERIKNLLVKQNENGRLNKNLFEIYEIIKYHHNLQNKNLNSNGEFNNFKLKMYDLFSIAFPVFNRFRFAINLRSEGESTLADELIQKNSYKFVDSLLKIQKTLISKNAIPKNNPIDPRQRNLTKPLQNNLGLLKWTTHADTSCSAKILCLECRNKIKSREILDQSNENISLIEKQKVEFTFKEISNYKNTNDIELVRENLIDEEFEKAFEKNSTREKCLHDINNLIKSFKSSEMIRVEYADEQNLSNKENLINQEIEK